MEARNVDACMMVRPLRQTTIISGYIGGMCVGERGVCVYMCVVSYHMYTHLNTNK